MGKLVAAFVFFLAASALAIHESKPPPPPPETRASPPIESSAPIEHTPPSRAIHDEVPPWVKYAVPPAPPPVTGAPPPLVLDSGDYVDAVDKCPDQPNDNDDDGCPEPEGLRDRIILID